MAMNQMQGMQQGVPEDEAGDRERRDGREDTYNVGLRSLQEIGLEAGRPLLAGTGGPSLNRNRAHRSIWVRYTGEVSRGWLWPLSALRILTAAIY